LAGHVAQMVEQRSAYIGSKARRKGTTRKNKT
jgi:hypothetical protein